MSGLAAAIPENVKDLLTSGLARPCSYGGSRPGCQLLAVVRYGPAALCAACDQRRSTLTLIRQALEAAGAEFTNGNQPGVRLRKVGPEK